MKDDFWPLTAFLTLPFMVSARLSWQRGRGRSSARTGNHSVLSGVVRLARSGSAPSPGQTPSGPLAWREDDHTSPFGWSSSLFKLCSGHPAFFFFFLTKTAIYPVCSCQLMSWQEQINKCPVYQKSLVRPPSGAWRNVRVCVWGGKSGDTRCQAAGLVGGGALALAPGRMELGGG